MIQRIALALLVLLGTTGGLATAAPRQKKKKSKKGPVWPVPNPTFHQRDFQPSNNNRQISGVFGPRLKWGSGRYDHHEGLDFYAQFDPQTYPRGAHPIYSVMPGTVTEVIAPASPEGTETGNKVVVTHDVPWTKFGGSKEWGMVQTAYLHLSAISVSKGQRVAAGDEVGKAGATGYTSTVHLHFNCYRAGGRQVNVNPARLFSPKRFPGQVAPLNKKTVEIDWLERNVSAGTALVRIYLPYNAYTFDGVAFLFDKDASRVVSFEKVSAEQRRERDTGDRGLIPGLRLFPLRYNGGGALPRVQPSRAPAGWPLNTYPPNNSKGVAMAIDVLATGLPEKVKKVQLVVLGVLGEKIKFKAPGWRKLVK